ncbi:DgyrCDS7242 [Dimorphilus gyrociliatus]|uniref:DgyrCDS7242 n=1 Tax=Dimorphilus gyrociliatus TaxID=2664684 RepID=A0A7I8VQN8_9ANNE|nr:DgyrCDS7242 [Dimorphilus gyrociliatus]
MTSGTTVLSKSRSVIQYLHDPSLVAYFQELCGIRRYSANGMSKNGTNGKSYENGKNKKQKEKDFVITNKSLDVLFQIGSALGNELFLTFFFSWFFWSVDSFVGRRVCMFWAVYMYIGQATKDFLKYPRPASPPVIRLEKRYELEYGFPSTHAMTGVGLPVAAFIFTYTRYDYYAYIGIIICSLWGLLVGLSRLYLGMHSILDILAGYVYIFLITPIFLPILDILDPYILDYPYTPIVIPSILILIMAFYPKCKEWNSARGDTALVLGIAGGIMIGHWFAREWNLMTRTGYEHQSLKHEITMPSLKVCSIVFIRQVVGLIILVITRFTFKYGSIYGLCKIFGFDWRNVEHRKFGLIEIPYKLITYNAMAINAVILAPSVFELLNIDRSDFRGEL